METRQLYTKALKENTLLNIPPLLKECEQMYSLLILKDAEEERFFLNASFGVLYKTLLEYDKSYQYFSEAIPFAQTFLQSMEIVPFYVIYCKVLTKKELYVQAIELLNIAKEECQKENALEQLANVYFEIGTNFAECGLTTQALNHFHLSLEISTKLQKDFLTTQVFLSLGISHSKITEYELSRVNLLKSLDFAIKIDSEDLIAKIYFELGILSFETGKQIQAEEYFHKSIEFSILSNLKRVEANAYFKIAEIYFPKKNIDLSLEYFQKALTVSATVGFREMMFMAMIKVASIHILQNVFTKAVSLLEKASKIIENSERQELFVQLHGAYAELYHSQKNWEEYEHSNFLHQKASETLQKSSTEKLDKISAEFQKLLAIPQVETANKLTFESVPTQTKYIVDNKDESKAFLHLFEHAPLGICITTTENVIVSINKEFQKIFADRSNEYIGRNFSELLTAEYSIELSSHSAKLISNPNLKYSVEEQYILPQRNQIWLRRTTSMSFIPEFDQIVFIHMLENIHERKRAEKELVVTLSKMHRNTDLLLDHKRKLVEKNEEFTILNAELERKNEQLLKLQIAEQNIATQLQSQYVEAVSLQNSLLPRFDYIQQCFEKSYIFNIPCDSLGAKKDFYWVFSVPSTATKFVAVADCSLSGYSTILLSVLGVSLLTSIVYEEPSISPSAILSKFHSLFQKTLQSNFETKQYYSFDIALLKIEKDKCVFAGANNPLYYVKQFTNSDIPNTLDIIDPSYYSIGGVYEHEERIFEDHVLVRDVTTMFYLTTNGFSKQYNEEMNTPFQTNIKEKLLNLSTMPLEEQIQLLQEEHKEFSQFSRLIDDILLIAIQVDGQQNEMLQL